MTATFHDFAERRRSGAKILDRLGGILEGAELETGDACDRLRLVADRAREGRFVVLLIGCFSTGKSTLLNALLGSPVLPVKVNPCTAILTELVYGEAPSVEVRYRGGERQTLSLDDFLGDFQLQTQQQDRAGAEVSDRFGDIDRAVVAYPLPLLDDGVVLVDSPGLDDDAARTARTLSSLPDADAVIMVLNASRFLTDLERRTLRRELLPRGLTNLFFPVTMADLLEAISDDPEGDLAEMRSRAQATLGPLCVVDGVDRFDERCFFLDARGALGARFDRKAVSPRDPVDAEALDRSGLLPFERALEGFLVQERGRAQLAILADTARRVRSELARQAEIDQATASASVEELRARQEELAPRFDQLQAIAERVGITVDRFIERQQALVWQDLRDFLARAEDELPDAIASFDLRGLAGLDMITPAGRERAQTQLREQLEEWLSERVAVWQRGLRPRMEASLRDLRKELAADGQDFDALVSRIVTDFAGGVLVLSGDKDSGEPVDPVERWFSVAVGAMLLSPGAMAAGWVEGYEGALKGAASRLGVRVALLALGAMLGPVGWAGLVLYVVSDVVLLVVTGGGQARRMRTRLAASLRGKLVARADEARDDIEAQVAAGLGPLRDGLVAAAQAEADALHEQLRRTVSARESAVRDATDRASEWTEVLGQLDDGVSALAALVPARDS